LYSRRKLLDQIPRPEKSGIDISPEVSVKVNACGKIRTDWSFARRGETISLSAHA
jgi:threonine dehydrogenase-like Zn-dependent dehydrogenase